MIAFALLALAGAGAAGAPPASMAFAFSDAAGRRVLVPGSPASLGDPRALRTAICADGRIVAVSYARSQAAAPDDTGRHTAQNLDRLAGHLYAVTSAEGVAANATCLLTAALGRGARAVLLAAGARPACPRELVEPLERAEKARADSCFALGPVGGDRGAAIAFVKGVTTPTLLISYAGPGGVFVKELRAAEKRDATSCWRVDDACELDPAAYRLVVLHAGGATRLVLLGAAPEGEHAELAELRGGEIVPVLEAYRYWSPL